MSITMDIAEKIQSFDDLEEEICKHFGLSSAVLLSVENAVAWWRISGDYLKYGYGDLEKDLDDGQYYGGDVIREFVVRRESHTLIYYDNGCGDNLYFVVPSKGEVTDPGQCEALDEA